MSPRHGCRGKGALLRSICNRHAQLGRLGEVVLRNNCLPQHHHTVQMREKIAEAPAASRNSIQLLLWLLTTRLGTLILCGRAAITRWPFLQPFAALGVTQRQAAITSWRTSPLAKLRQVCGWYTYMICTMPT